MKEPLAGERSRGFRGRPSRCPAVVLSDPGLFPLPPWGLALGLVSLPGPSCSHHSFGVSSPAICLLSQVVLKLNFFSGCSHTSAFNPFRLKLWIGKSRRKTDDSQTGAMTMTSQRQPTSWGLQLRRLHKVHGGTNPSCSPCLSFPSPPPSLPCFRHRRGEGWGSDLGMISGDCPGQEVTVMAVVTQKSQPMCITENSHGRGISDD